MRKSLGDFNIKRFLGIAIPFGFVAILMIITKPNKPVETNTHPFPIYNLHIESKAARGSIILNGISIANHKSTQNLRKSKISLTPWLKNGENKLYISTGQPLSDQKPFLKVTLHTHPVNSTPITQALFEFSNPTTEGVTIEAQGLPEWNWQKGEATFHNSAEIKKAVKELHQAFTKRDTKKIRKIEAPLFEDMVKVTGREGLERRQYRDEIIKKGRVDPLKPLLIVPFANGKVMRVTQKDGEAPIRIYYRYGNGGKVILTGKYWSKIDGKWRVVR